MRGPPAIPRRPGVVLGVGTDEQRPLGFAAEAIVQRATRLHREGRHFAAALEWQAAVRLVPTDATLALRWADACVRAGQTGRAAEAYLAAAHARAAAGQRGPAMVLARRAMEIDAGAVVRERIELVVRRCGAPAEALCEAAARGHVAAGRFDAAVRLRELLVECDPGSVTKTMRAAEIGLEHGDRGRATETLVETASRMHATGRTGEFIRVAEATRASGWEDADTLLELGRVYFGRGEVREAAARLEALRALAPERLEGIELLVRCYAGLGETTRGIAVLEETARAAKGEALRRDVERLFARAEGFDGRDAAFRGAVRRLRERGIGGPPPMPMWARDGSRRIVLERCASESSGA